MFLLFKKLTSPQHVEKRGNIQWSALLEPCQKPRKARMKKIRSLANCEGERNRMDIRQFVSCSS